MRFYGAQVSNVKRLKAVSLDIKNENLVRIAGKNGQGKTSLVDAFLMLLGGKRAQTPLPVRQGELTAEIVAETEEYILRKNITFDGKETLEITTRSGLPVPGGSKQSVIDSIYAGAVDPAEFVRLKAQERKNYLLQYLGVNLSLYEERHKAAYEKRKTANSMIKILQAKLVGKTRDREVEHLTPRNQAELLEEYKAALASNQAVTKFLNDLEQARTRVAQLEFELDKLKSFIAQSEAAEGVHLIDVTAFEQNIQANQNIIDRKKENQELDSLWKELEKYQLESATADKELQNIKEEQAAKLLAANIPIPSVSVGEEDIEVAGVPFSEMASSHALVLASEILLSVCGELKFLAIRNAPYVDEQSMQKLAEIAVRRDATILIEVGGEDGTVIIEDGLVK